MIVISPELPEGRTYEQRVTTTGIAAAVRKLCQSLQVDRKHIGLTGSEAGGTAALRIALELPKFFTDFSPINAHEVVDPHLKQSLAGTQVRIYTDVNEGFATGRANNMHAALEGNDPKPEIIYLGEKELGTQPAAAYCYSRPEFYAQLLSLEPPTPEAAHASTTRRWIVSISIAILLFAYLLYRLKYPPKHKK